MRCWPERRHGALEGRESRLNGELSFLWNLLYENNFIYCYYNIYYSKYQ
jgi:hypothetical protein